MKIQIFVEELNSDVNGNIRDNSTSKIRKIITNRKYRVVNGERDPTNGSNPHSKGENFS